MEPSVLPAAVAIDWSRPGTPIGARPGGLSPKTLARIRAGLDRYALPVTVPAGGTWHTEANPVTMPLPTRTTRENDALAVPPLLVPVEGRDGKHAAPAGEPLRTQTARNETGLAWVPFIAELRGGHSDARPVLDALATVTASGNHHGLVTPTSLEPVRWDSLLIPYYGTGTGTARPVAEPVGTLTTHDRYGLTTGSHVDLDDVLFRMLEPYEIGRGMAFTDAYTVLGTKRERVRQYGNAVTPPVAEVLVSALVETITGTPLDRETAVTAA